MPEVDIGHDVDDDYLLALLIRARDLGAATIDGQVVFVLPQSREVYRSIASGAQVDVLLTDSLERALALVPAIEPLSLDTLFLELELKRRQIRMRLLESQRAVLTDLLLEGGLSQDEGVRLLELYRQEMQTLL